MDLYVQVHAIVHGIMCVISVFPPILYQVMFTGCLRVRGGHFTGHSLTKVVVRWLRC